MSRKRRLTNEQAREACSDLFLTPSYQIPEDPAEAYREAVRLIREAGWGFYTRSDVTAHGRNYTMTLRKRIALAADWEQKHIGHRAVILWHELVHIRQRQRWGNARFVMRYAGARGRFCIEVPAYRMSIRAYELLTGHNFDADAYIRAKLPAVRRDYKLGSIRWADYERVATLAWSRERR